MSIIKTRLNKAFQNILVITLLVMFLTVLLQIFARYVLNVSIPWTEEIARYLLVLITFLGAAIVIKDNQHIAIRYLLEKIPDKIRRGIDIGINGVIILFLIAIFKGSLVMTKLTWNTPAGTISWITTGKIYLILPASIILMILYLIEQIILSWKHINRIEKGEG